MANRDNQTWSLESFVDSLILELDKAQDTLAVKGINRKLTYTVKDVALDLHIFPQYRDGAVRFVTASPGDTGASRLSIQLGSISNRQIRETASDPVSRDDVAIDAIDEIDEEVRASLKKVGIRSAKDLERMEQRNVDLEEVVADKVEPAKRVSYGDLAGLINKARRKRLAPRVSRISTSKSHHVRHLEIEGDHLAIAETGETFPIALLNGKPIEVVRASEHHLDLVAPEERVRPGSNQLQVALDPYALMTLEIKT